jgi:signal transduction histidine kinase
MVRKQETLVLVPAVAAAVGAVWATLDADFLRYPGWLSVQKADLILGPVLVGLYWRRVRPASRFGWLLIAYGFLCAGYITQSFDNSWLFGIGLDWESLIFLGNLLLILTFPTGRLDRPAAKLVFLGGVAAAALNVVLVMMLPQTSAGGAISGCRELCPKNALALTPDVSLALDLIKPFQIVVVVVVFATIALLFWRIATGTPPQRRAVAIGTSFALLFLVLQAVYLLLSLFDVDVPRLQNWIQWAYTGARAAVWYGFLFALIAAQLFAARALRRLVRGSLRRPSQRELEAMLRGPLGDPGLQLRFWDEQAGQWEGPLQPDPGCTLTLIERDTGPAVALIHDVHLNDDPELLQAAGAVALLAAENAELDAGWHNALDALRRSRARITQSIDAERRRVALDLHDGVQQRLSVIHLRLVSAAEQGPDQASRDRLQALSDDVRVVIDEVRAVSQGLYPRLLGERDLVTVLEQAIEPVPVRHNEIGRFAPEVEAAVYYACLEAVQNATKHAGAGASVTVTLQADAGSLSFEVTDDGSGFAPATASEGLGLQSLHDRIGAVGGRLSITSSPGGGTVVSGWVPMTSGPEERPQIGTREQFLQDERARPTGLDELGA